MKPFDTRLHEVLRKGNLRTADLARWFDRPHATVSGWVKNGHQPGGGPSDIDHAFAMLGLLETLIQKRKGFPVPRLSPRQRIEHLNRWRDTVMNAKGA